MSGCGILGGSHSNPPDGGGNGAGGNRACDVGDELCPCYGNNTCNGLLTCASGICVRVGGGSGGASGGGTGGAVVNPGSGGAVVNPGSGGSIVNPGSGGAVVNPGSGGSIVNPGSGGAVLTNPALIDDFADCDANIREIDGRKGAWYKLASAPTGVNFTVGQPPDSTWVDRSCGAFVTGACPGCDVAGIGVILAPGVYDLSRYTGFRVTYESDATLYIAVKSTDGSAYGYARSAGITGTGAGGTRIVNFSSLTPDISFHGFSKADEIQFTLDDISKTSGFGLGIHKLELF